MGTSWAADAVVSKARFMKGEVWQGLMRTTRKAVSLPSGLVSPNRGPKDRKVFASEELPALLGARALGFLQGETESLWRTSISMPSTISEW